MQNMKESEDHLTDDDTPIDALPKGIERVMNRIREVSQVSTVGPLPSIPPPPPSLSEKKRLATHRHEHFEHTEPISTSESTGRVQHPSSLDFERVVNEFSIQAIRDRVFGEPEPPQKTPDTKPLLSGAWSDEDYRTFDVEFPPPPPPPPPPPTKRRCKRTPLGYTGRTATRWVLTNATGLITGGCSILIVSCTESISSWRSNLLDTLWRQGNRSYLIFFLYAGTNLGLALLSSSLCVFLAPEAIGSGIPEGK
jgi:hypothetical protein